MPTPTLRVRDWDSLYENHRSRELKKLEYVPVKNKMDGDGYSFLLEHKNGAAHLGAWVAILQIASRCKDRGLLVGSDGCPYDTAALSRISRIPKKIFDEVIPRLIDGCKWLESLPLVAEVAASTPGDDDGGAAEARDERGIVAESREIDAGSSRHVRACDSLLFPSSSFLEKGPTKISEIVNLVGAVADTPVQPNQKHLPRGYAMDEGYAQFRQACEDFGMNLIESDFTGFAWNAWCRLSTTDRLAAIQGIRDRHAAGVNPDMVPKPEKYLDKREWERPVKGKPKGESLAERMARA